MSEAPPDRFASMQRIQRMKAQYQRLHSLQAEFDLDSDSDNEEKGDEPIKKSAADSNADHDGSENDGFSSEGGLKTSSSPGRASVRKLRKKSVWADLKATINVNEARKIEAAVTRRRSTLVPSPGVGISVGASPGARTSIRMSDSKRVVKSAAAVEETKKVLSPEEEDKALDDYWAKHSFQLPGEPPLEDFRPPAPPKLEEELLAEKERSGILIGKIPKLVIKEQKDILKARLWDERERAVKAMKAKERDLQWREALAKKRIEELEQDTRTRMAAEKEKNEEQRLAREKLLGREFRRARESLEASLKHQNSQLGEVFGELDQHARQSMARKMYIKSTNLPQPVEFRVHLLRSVKSKLSKGAYVLMLTQYESLGGRPLAWTKLGAYGIGEEFPGTTKAVKHQGRYFDRNLKFEDSCFALCPPPNMLKPGFCFLLELFQLKSRTNAEDKQVAWTALPMCNEEMNITEGRFKLPLLRGQHSPRVQGYRQMEKAIADDLDNWLCNIYFEVRAFSLSEMSAVVENSRFYQDAIKAGGKVSELARLQRSQVQDLVKLNRYLNFDFLNKRLFLQNGTGKYSRTFGQKESETDMQYQPDVKTLLHRRRNPSGANDEALSVGANKTRKHVNLKPVDSLGNLMDHNSDDEEKRDALLLGGAHNASFNHFKDGFGSYSSKDLYSRDSLRQSVWTPIYVTWLKTKAFFKGEVYMPSESDGVSQTRRYVNPNSSQRSPDPSVKHHLHFARSEHLNFSSQSTSKIEDDIETGYLNSVAMSQADADRKQQKREARREQRRAVRASMSGETHKAEHVSAKSGHGNSVLTKDMPDRDPVLHSVKFVHRESGLVLGTLDGNDAHLDSDGFSSDSASDASDESSVEVLEEVDDFFNTPAGLDSRADVTVIERGLETETSAQAKRLHEEQSGKLVGIETVEGSKGRYFASSGLDRKVIRRLQSDGLRLDSEVLDNNDATNTEEKGNDAPSKDNQGKEVNERKRLWTPLENRKDFDLYDMSLASDIAKRAHLLPSAVAACKIRFLLLEAFGDIMGHKWGSFEFFATLVTLAFSFWLRIYIHFLAQFLYLGAIKVPVYGFELAAFLIKYKYMASGLTLGKEIALLFVGPGACIAALLSFMLAGHMFSKMAGNIPDGLSTFISSFGLMTVLDPLLILIVDLISRNYNCESSSSVCITDYTAAECTCFTGDWMKLWDRMNHETPGSGITGLLVTLMIYFSAAVISSLFYYEYLINIHRNGRILDLWRRVHSTSEEFFLPDDFEVSREELAYICTKAGQWRGGGGDIRRLTVSKLIEKDADDEDFLRITKLYAIHEMSITGANKKLYRQFLFMPDGYIVEVFGDFKFHDTFKPTSDAEKRLVLMENWNEQKGGKAPTQEPAQLNASQRTKRGLFAGLERA